METNRWEHSLRFLYSILFKFSRIHHLNLREVVEQILEIFQKEVQAEVLGLMIKPDNIFCKIFEKKEGTKVYDTQNFFSHSIEESIRKEGIVITKNSQNDYPDSSSLSNISGVIAIELSSYKKMVGILYLQNPDFGLIDFLTGNQKERSEITLLMLGKILGTLLMNIYDESKEIDEFNEIVEKNVSQQIKQIAVLKDHILILGDIGTEKELIARVIHKLSPQQNYPFILENVGYLSELSCKNLLLDTSSTIFMADGGIVFLDQIDQVSAKILSQFFDYIQKNSSRHNVRFIFGAQENLSNELCQKIELYFIKISSLQDRRGDIPSLAKFFLKKYSKNIDCISHDAMQAINDYSWPGNLLQLERSIRLAVIMAKDNSQILKEHLPKEILYFSPTAFLKLKGNEWNLKKILKDTESLAIRKALSLFENQSRSSIAKLLGISRDAFLRKCKEHKIGIGKKGRKKNDSEI